MSDLLDKLLVVDTETIGISLCKMMEFGAIKVSNGEHVSFRVNPGVPCEPEAFAVHGISDEDVANCPAFSDGYRPLVQGLCDNHILIGHNIAFDLRVLTLEGIAASNQNSICTQKLAGVLIKQGILPKMSKQLQLIRQALGIEEDAAHSALGDINVTLQIFNRMRVVFATLYNIKDIDDPALIKKMVEDSNISPRKQTMFFGPHKGIEFVDIYKQDQKYLKNLFKSDSFPLGAKRDIYNLYKSNGEDLGFYDALREPIFF